MATQEWLAKNVAVSDGVPTFKTKSKGTIMTLGFRVLGSDVDLTLRLGAGKPALKVRCFEFKTGLVSTKMASLYDGYSHFVSDFESQQGSDAADDESSDDMIYDSHGLEGLEVQEKSHDLDMSACLVLRSMINVFTYIHTSCKA